VSAARHPRDPDARDSAYVTASREAARKAVDGR
jgi:hypothetical protein